MIDDNQEFTCRRFITPSTGTVIFSEALNRSVNSSMNALVYHIQMWLAKRDLSPYETICKLYEIPMSANNYTNSRAALKSLELEQNVPQ